jgi:hypothetical protein
MNQEVQSAHMTLKRTSELYIFTRRAVNYLPDDCIAPVDCFQALQILIMSCRIAHTFPNF